jgi:hypothetical protein
MVLNIVYFNCKPNLTKNHLESKEKQKDSESKQHIVINFKTLFIELEI